MSALATAPPRMLPAGLATLLQGVDDRGRTRYGLPALADDRLVNFGSCTANPITPALLAQWHTLEHRSTALDPQRHLQTLFGATQCRLAASGTDAEYSCALAMGPHPYCTVLMDPREIGSGCERAAAGLTHTLGCPVTAPLAIDTAMEKVLLRDEAGRVLSQDQIDSQLFAIAQRHDHLPLLVHHVSCSKTGLSAPSEAACRQLQDEHAAGVRVVVDASQGRFAAQDVQRWLAQGWAVIITGSKYFGAPPFCGATLFPAGWPQARGFAVAPGLLARWRLALENFAPPPQRSAWRNALQTAFVPQLPRGAVDNDTPHDRQGILSFDLGLNADQTLALHRRLIQRGFFIGQPVAAGRRSLLRVALGAHTNPDQMVPDLARLARTLRDELRHG